MKLEKPPTAPKSLGGCKIAKKKFRDLCKMLIASSGLRDIDVLYVELASVAYAKWHQAIDRLNDGELVCEVVVSERTVFRANAYAAEAHKFQREYAARLVDLGLAGAGRVKSKKDSQETKGRKKRRGLAGLRIYGAGG